MKTIKITGSSSARAAVTNVKGLILVASSDNASIVLDDSTDGTGTDIIGLKAVMNESRAISFDGVGIEFDTGVYATISGADAVAYIIIG